MTEPIEIKRTSTLFTAVMAAIQKSEAVGIAAASYLEALGHDVKDWQLEVLGVSLKPSPPAPKAD